MFKRTLLALFLSLLWVSSAFAYGHSPNLNWSKTLTEDVILNHRIVYCVQVANLSQDDMNQSFHQWIDAIKNDVYVKQSDGSLILLKNVPISIRQDCSSTDSHVVKIRTYNMYEIYNNLKEISSKLLGGNFYRDTNTIALNLIHDRDTQRRSALHEMGHAFGLCDQYDTQDIKTPGYKNCDPQWTTPYRFQDSLMSGNENIHFDDVEGVIRLFDRYIHHKRSGFKSTMFDHYPLGKIERTYKNGYFVGDYKIYDSLGKLQFTYTYANKYNIDFKNEDGDSYKKNNDGTHSFVLYPLGISAGGIKVRMGNGLTDVTVDGQFSLKGKITCKSEALLKSEVCKEILRTGDVRLTEKTIVSISYNKDKKIIEAEYAYYNSSQPEPYLREPGHDLSYLSYYILDNPDSIYFSVTQRPQRLKSLIGDTHIPLELTDLVKEKPTKLEDKK